MPRVLHVCGGIIYEMNSSYSVGFDDVKFVFLDRDGVLNRKAPGRHLLLSS